MDSYFKNKYRRGQVISTYGVGALANFPDDSLIAASLDFWPSEVARDDGKKLAIEDAVKVQDERLAKRISKSLGKRIGKVSTQAQVESGILTSHLIEVFKNHKIIKIFQQEEKENHRILNFINNLKEKSK